MAVSDFKNTEVRTAFRILDKDRAIIERGMRLSTFGRGREDFIEFTLYDAADNQLPQGDSGELTRHININQLNITEYFLVKDNGEDGGVEYFIDVEKLIREAGYNQGIFKVQYQLLNNRVGRWNTEKLYIHEIAPSRTEVRLVPVTNKDGIVDEDLFERYQTFTSKGTFRDDIIYFIDDFLDSINFRDVIEKFIGKFGKQYLEQIKKEFGVTDFDTFILDVTTRVKESAKFYVEGKYWNPKDQVNYGKPRPDFNEESDILDLNKILSNIIQVTCDIIDILLPKRNIGDTEFDWRVLPSEDVKTFIENLTSDTTYEPEATPDTNNPDPYTEEEVEQEEEEILQDEEPPTPSAPFLKVSPKQPPRIPSNGGQQIFDVDSSTPVAISFRTSDGFNNWVDMSANSLSAGRNDLTVKFGIAYAKKPISSGVGSGIIPQVKNDPDFLLNNSVQDTFEQLSRPGGLSQSGLQERYDTGDYGPMADILDRLGNDPQIR